jgi:hypothetical protein
MFTDATTARVRAQAQQREVDILFSAEYARHEIPHYCSIGSKSQLLYSTMDTPGARVSKECVHLVQYFPTVFHLLGSSRSEGRFVVPKT